MITNNPKIKALLNIGPPKNFDWPDYVAQYGFNQDDIPELIQILTDESLNLEDENSSLSWAPLHACRALGQLQAERAVMPLLNSFDFLYIQDWALAEIHRAFAMIGPVAIAPLARKLQEPAEDELIPALAVKALAAIAVAQPAHKDQVVEIFRAYMEFPNRSAKVLNGILVARLLELNATQAIDGIRRLYTLNCVDLICGGDLEDAEISLGFRKERSTPRLSIEELLDLEEYGAQRQQEEPEPPAPALPINRKIGRNDPCVCGSGHKYKKCCGMS
ncbi:DUF1186 domain-containing protein [Hahella chejuensis]|nr:DUF1186 domain-containing protein [Hahella chejuensis]